MLQNLFQQLRSDARHGQILVLSTLILLGNIFFQFGISPVRILLILSVSLITQYLLSKWVKCSYDARSPLITSCSLLLILRTANPWLDVLAAFIAISAKFLLRIQDKHIYNPANIGIVIATVFFTGAWISPGQWGTGLLLAVFLAFCALMVLSKARTMNMALLFLGLFTALTFGRALWLGDPMSIPVHELKSGTLLLFSFFMISDPKTIPEKFGGRFIFALTAAIITFIFKYQFFIPGGLLFSLALTSTAYAVVRLVLINQLNKEPLMNTVLNRLLQRVKPSLSQWLSFGLILSMMFSTVAFAFCGFYVAKADTKLFNKASKVVVVRHDNKTVITMVNDYQGDLKEFAMVVPVPVAISRNQVHVTKNSIVDHLDAYTSPRLVEYHDSDPCRRYMYEEMDMIKSSAMPQSAGAMRAKKDAAKALGVTIEDEYSVGEYDILVLSAKQSNGLQIWLNQNGYKTPAGAEKVLDSYIKQGVKFFVAKINLEKMEKEGSKFLSPLQVAFESPKFMLPIRLGTVNSNGSQDLFAFMLTKDGRVETTNYRTVKIPTGMDIPLYVKDVFGDFYKDMFSHQVKKEGMSSVFMEYAWDMGWCDPCAADPLSKEELRELGVFWIQPDYATPKPMAKQAQRTRIWNPPGGGAQDVFVTRLHVRYDAEHFPEDLKFQETGDRTNFQARYVMRHPWKGNMECEGGKEYKRGLPNRFEKEAQNLNSLTGWNLPDIRSKMEKNGQSFQSTAVYNPVSDWLNWIWPDNNKNK